MYQQFLAGIWSAISSCIDLLKDSNIASIFGGVSLWIVLITFFCAWVVLRFYIHSFGPGRINRGD